MVLDPYLPLWLIGLIGAAALLIAAFSIWHGGKGALLRLLAACALVAALLNPQRTEQTRAPSRDIGVVAIDASQSMAVDARGAQANAAATQLAEAMRASGLDVRQLRLGETDDPANGTKLFQSLDTALARVPKERLAGIVLLTDGITHDVPNTRPASAPLHILTAGDKALRDRRLILEQAPAFALVDQNFKVQVKVDDGPRGQGQARLRWRVDGKPMPDMLVPVGRSATLTATATRRGPISIDITAEALPNEPIVANNSVLATVNGVRDRLKVVLVSGEPNLGERLWRDILKSDPAVDLVHFTILRLPTSIDATPIQELSLIPFPVEELFVEKLDTFDLVIFDKFGALDVLPEIYLANVAAYVRDGGAVMVLTGPEALNSFSLTQTALGDILPGRPTGPMLSSAFRPTLTEAGARHPITASLPRLWAEQSGQAQWGLWYRQVAGQPRGDILMRGASNAALLVTGQAGEGRSALMFSDQVNWKPSASAPTPTAVRSPSRANPSANLQQRPA
jgi:hypothetical protein